MTAQRLVFIHGRAQEGKDSVALKAEWVAALGKGLARSGLTLPMADADIRFPYYGDTLAQLVAGQGPVPRRGGARHRRGQPG